MSDLFSSFELKSTKLKNRIAIPPMCQYMATDGLANDWHKTHYSALAHGGAGLVIVEATAVSPEGRITPKCLGLWNDKQKEELRDIARLIKKGGAVPGIQIGHAGRKASANIPWEGDDHIPLTEKSAWEIIGPSAKAFGGGLSRVPEEMSLGDIARVQRDFVEAAKRALDAGFEWLELHFAHGYLGQSFFSTHSNQRTDEYGGSYENRSRFSKEVLKAVREVWPSHLPLTIRFGVIEYDGNDEKTLNESIQLVKEWKELGLDFLNVSVGFSTPEAKVPWGTAFLAPIAERIRKEVNIPVASAWGFGLPKIADAAVRKGQLDLVMIARAHLENPNWSYFAAKELGKEKAAWTLPAPYAFWLERYRSPTE